MDAAVDSDEGRRPVPAVIAVVLREDRVLLVKRADPPDAGRWGFPGGKIVWGQTIEAAAQRELLEETGMDGVAAGVLTVLEAFTTTPLAGFFAVLCRWVAGEPAAAGDALDARWLELGDLDEDDPAFSRDVAAVAQRAAAMVAPRA
jgi:8-oxo-dGTP diphosphatase